MTTAGGILVIDKLVDVPHEDHDLMIQRFANYIRMVFKQSRFILSLRIDTNLLNGVGTILHFC